MSAINHMIMTFGTTGGGSVTLRIPRANPSVTEAGVREAMNQIVSAAAITTKTGRINSAQKAVLQKVQQTDIVLS